MESLLAGHLLDGMLGRACALLSVALLAGVYLWRDCLQRAIPGARTLVIAAVMIGWAGGLLSLNSTFFQLSASFDTVEAAPLQWQYMLPLLLETRYGVCWLSFGLLLVAIAGLQQVRYLPWMILGLTVCLVMNSHAAEYGLLTWVYAFDFIHLSSMLLWMGGLLLLVLGRVSAMWKADAAALQAFSRVILPVFLLGLVTGLLRAAMVYAEYRQLNLAYLSLIAIKAGLAIAVCLCALRLRHLLKHGRLKGPHGDDVLSLELFFALLLLLAVAMLTQLPPL